MNPTPRPCRTFNAYLGIGVRGIAMGAADVVPGVSGGTIAMISGIYEELIDSIRSIGPEAVARLFREGIGSFWRAINGNFLLALMLGIGLSVLSLSRLILHGLATQPIPIWSFFFGLVLASALFVGRRIRAWRWDRWLALVAGTGLSYGISLLSPAQSNTAPWFVFLSGAIAICAMILPGISGSFLLVLLGMYQYVLEAIHRVQLVVLGIFGAGALVGLLSFSRLLSWLLHRHQDRTIAALLGIMLGSLNRIWPWKQVIQWSQDHRPLVVRNVWPSEYPHLPSDQLVGSGADPQIGPAVLLGILGFTLILLFERRTASEG